MRTIKLGRSVKKITHFSYPYHFYAAIHVHCTFIIALTANIEGVAVLCSSAAVWAYIKHHISRRGLCTIFFFFFFCLCCTLRQFPKINCQSFKIETGLSLETIPIRQYQSHKNVYVAAKSSKRENNIESLLASLWHFNDQKLFKMDCSQSVDFVSAHWLILHKVGYDFNPITWNMVMKNAID